MNANILICPPQVTVTLTELREQLQDGEIDIGMYNRKVLELQVQVEQDKNQEELKGDRKR
jgi:hypothetical protein